MAEYNSAYTGAQIDEAVGAVVGDTLAKKSEAARFGTITLPKGRVKGDVNGDGVINADDKNLALNIMTGSYTPTDIEKWCADMNGDGTVDSADSLNISKIYNGTYSGALSDYYGNWAYDTTIKQWAAEILHAEMTASSNVFICKSEFDKILKIEPKDGSIKVYASIPPISDVEAVIEYGGTGRGKVVDDLPDVFIATYGQTTIRELWEAHSRGEVIVCWRSNNKAFAPLTYAPINDDSNEYWFGPTAGGQLFVCSAESKWSVTRAMKTSGFTHASYHGTGGPDPITPDAIGAAPAILAHRVTLTAAGWDTTEKTQTVTVTDILADVTKQEIHAMPVDASAGNAYYSAGIMPVAQAANSLTFYAETVPTADIGVYVAIHPLKFS